MSVVNDEVRTNVKTMVCDVLELELDEINDTSLFVEEFGADSMRAIEILSALEITFRTKIDQSLLVRMVNLDGIYEVLEEVLNNKAAASTAPQTAR